MSKKKIWLIVFLVLIAVCAVIIWPHVKRSAMSRKLKNTVAIEQRVHFIQSILSSDDDADFALLEEYANESDLRAFDKNNRFFVFVDNSTGDIHLLPRKDATPVGAATLSFGQHDDAGVYLADSDNGTATFVIHEVFPDGDAGLMKHTFEFFGDTQSPQNHIRSDITPQELEEWQQRADWPKHWCVPPF